MQTSTTRLKNEESKPFNVRVWTDSNGAEPFPFLFLQVCTNQEAPNFLPSHFPCWSQLSSVSVSSFCSAITLHLVMCHNSLCHILTEKPIKSLIIKLKHLFFETTNLGSNIKILFLK